MGGKYKQQAKCQKYTVYILYIIIQINMKTEKKEVHKEKNGEQLNVQIEQVEEEYSCSDGKLFCIPERRKWLFTLLLVNIPAIIHEILHVQWFSHNHLFGALYVLFIAHFINFWASLNLSMQDPGYIQKIKYGYQIDSQFVNIPKNQHINTYVVVSYVVTAKQMSTRLKLCTTCNIYRPNRASHCNDCGVCVERMDHHCPWIGTCVGKRNHKYFYTFLASLMAMMITTVVMCIMLLVGNSEDPSSFVERLRNYPMAIVLIIIPCFPGLIFVGIMFGFHSYLIANDITTKQFLDQKWAPLIGNPQRKMNCLKNIVKLLMKTQQRKSKYKHQAYPYYNQQIQDSSNTNNHKNSKNSDPESSGKKKQVIINGQSSEQSLHNHQRAMQKLQRPQGDMRQVQTHQKLHI